jgi:hypothetical protein
MKKIRDAVQVEKAKELLVERILKHTDKHKKEDLMAKDFAELLTIYEGVIGDTELPDDFPSNKVGNDKGKKPVASKKGKVVGDTDLKGTDFEDIIKKLNNLLTYVTRHEEAFKKVVAIMESYQARLREMEDAQATEEQSFEAITNVLEEIKNRLDEQEKAIEVITSILEKKFGKTEQSEEEISPKEVEPVIRVEEKLKNSETFKELVHAYFSMQKRHYRR